MTDPIQSTSKALAGIFHEGNRRNLEQAWDAGWAHRNKLAEFGVQTFADTSPQNPYRSES